MRVKLTAPHVIDDVWYPRDKELDVSVVTPAMIGLDDEAQEAIARERIRVFGRWVGRWPRLHLLDDPPLERPLDDNRPVAHTGGGGPR